MQEVLRNLHERTMPTASKVSRRRYDLAGEVLSFMMANPGCVYRRNGSEYCCNDAYRRLIRELRERYVDLDLDDFAGALQVPLDTLTQWLGSSTRS
jgi:hypothetical protein